MMNHGDPWGHPHHPHHSHLHNLPHLPHHTHYQNHQYDPSHYPEEEEDEEIVYPAETPDDHPQQLNAPAVSLSKAPRGPDPLPRPPAHHPFYGNNDFSNSNNVEVIDGSEWENSGIPALPIPATTSEAPKAYHPTPNAHMNAPHADQASNVHREQTPKTLTAADHRVIIANALNITDPNERDTALINALKSCANELQAAEENHARANERMEDARKVFDWATHTLSGYIKPEPMGEALKKRGRKRKGEATKEEEDYDEKFVPPKFGPLLPPLVAVSGGGLTEEQVIEHRDAFYIKLCGKTFEDLDSYVPPAHLANLKNRAQLNEMTFIADHWNKGYGDMDVLTFRRQHKNFYTKMKIVTENIGRRTGHHLRDLAGGEGRKVFCRYGSNGESLMYICLEDLYDAIFEIHCLKGHRGWNSTKKLANLKYANLPQDQVKAFVDTCPVCIVRNSKMKRIKDEGEGTMDFDA